MACLMLVVAGALGIPMLGSGIAAGNLYLIVACGVLVSAAFAAGLHVVLRRPPSPRKGRLFSIGG